MRSLPRAARVYITVAILVGGAIVAGALLRGDTPWGEVLALAALYWIGEFAAVQTRLRSFMISMSFPVSLAAVLLVGPWLAALVCVIGGATRLAHTPWYKRAFNAAQLAVCAFTAGIVYGHVSGTAPHFAAPHFPGVMFAVAVAGTAHVLMNHLLVATVISTTTTTSFARLWWGGMSETIVPSLGYGLIGVAIAVLWSGGVGAVAGLLVLAPMLVARWAFQQYGEQHKAYEATVASLIQAVETKDYYTRGHSERVARASVMIAERVGMREDRLEMLRYAGMLHDVGKLGVPTKVLQKTGPLDEAEFAAITLHPTRGVEMVNGISFLDEARLGIRYHHERMDGLGYPEGLRGDRIPEFARIIAVADAFDSMTSTRSYRGARSVQSAIDELRSWSGNQFDAVMVEALIAAVQAEGWDASVEATDVVVDPIALVFGDHDDPSSRVAASLGGGVAYDPYDDMTAEQVS